MNRRSFIAKSAAVLALGNTVHDVFSSPNMMKVKPNKGRIGITFYSVRNELPNDFEGTLKKVSAMGYAQAELFKINEGDFFGHSMKETKLIFQDLGMSISGTHTSSKLLSENIKDPEWDFWKKIAEYVKTAGGKWAIQASLPGGRINNMDDLKRTAAHFDRTGEVCKNGGIKFAFHNHTEVFSKIDGEEIIDLLIKNTDPKLVFFQLDLGHTVNGGGDCLRLISQHSKRIPLWHASDFDTATRKYTWLGKGNVPYPKLFDLAQSSGVETLTVEQETLVDTFAACKSDFDYLKQFKWTKV